MIAVIVAGVALAIILGWVLSIRTPNVISRVDSTPETVNIANAPMGRLATATVTITVRAFDQKGNAVSGIAVTLRGSGMERTEIQTDAGDGTADGTATFANVHVQIPANSPTARIDVTVEASGFPTETDSIIVVRQ